jgi:hypothetical protein
MVVSGGGDNFSTCGFLEGALTAPQSELARSQVLLEGTGARLMASVPPTQVGRMLSGAEAAELIRRLDRR